MENICEICNNQSEAEVCDDCVNKFCKIEDKGNCYYCMDHSCIEKAFEVLCPVCRREVPNGKWEKHHLIPRSKNGVETIRLCNCCGDAVHKIFSLKEMKEKYNTLDSILRHPKIITWIKWVSKKPNDFNICMKDKKRK